MCTFAANACNDGNRRCKNFFYMPQNNNLRYISWGDAKSSSPNTLTIEDYDSISQSDCFFARKFDKKKSKELLNRIKQKLWF